ncbi:MAG TPA: LON peptidase substrate-binding domain-containing protein, partial [Candidatus Binatia bacterium]
MISEEPGKSEVASSPAETKSLDQVLQGPLLLLPLRNSVLFPSSVMPLTIGRPASLRALEEAVRREVPIGVVAQKDPKVDDPRDNDLYEIGTTADVLRMSQLSGEARQIVVRGRQRFKIVEYIQTDPFLVARALPLTESVPQSKEFEARILNLRKEASRALSLLPKSAAEVKALIETIQEPAVMIDMIAATLDLSTSDRQEILATDDLDDRAQKVSKQLQRQLQVLELSKKIQAETKESLEKAQREYFLRE